MKDVEGFKGLGRRRRRRMIRHWKAEGGGKSLKDWARIAGVGDAALVWFEHKRRS
jgi:hypothetical protein